MIVRLRDLGYTSRDEYRYLVQKRFFPFCYKTIFYSDDKTAAEAFYETCSAPKIKEKVL